MPYINAKYRDDLEEYLNPQTPGELNYLFYRIAKNYLHQFGMSYKTINDIVGAYESSKLEFYRRLAGPYEDEKILENGDVF